MSTILSTQDHWLINVVSKIFNLHGPYLNTDGYRNHQLRILNEVVDIIHEHQLNAEPADILVTIPTGSGKKPLISSLQLATATPKAAHLCHYIAINKSNLSYLHRFDNELEADGSEDIVQHGTLTLELLRTLELSDKVALDVSGESVRGLPKMLFAGTRRFLLSSQKYKGAYPLIIVDEPQLSYEDVKKIRAENPKAIFVYFSALPPKSLYDLVPII